MWITGGANATLTFMLTPADKKFLKEQFASKAELRDVRDGIDLLRKKVIESSLEKLTIDAHLRSLEASVFRNEEKSDKILGILDGFTGRIAGLDQENKMGAITLRRHGIQIQQLAKTTGTKISQ